MIVIADSNIFISAIYTPNGVIAKILSAKSKIQFFVPDYVAFELKAHLPEIAKKLGKSNREVKILMEKYIADVKMINSDSIPRNISEKAIEIVRDIDIDDFPFVALHLYTKHKLWTGDTVLIKGLKEKGFDICITTSELKNSLYKK
jgi:predicted nucleic acid-binding protein